MAPDDVIDRTEAALFLRAVRGCMGVSQTEFAKLVKASRRTLWSAEAGGEESRRAVAEETLRCMVVLAAQRAPPFITPPTWLKDQMTEQKAAPNKHGNES
jgi:DNA-binding XRE family transcriptional regulator